jgi:alpha-D-ribose 1-methylphosphonate 5-triphosphate synthase subunit PhnH
MISPSKVMPPASYAAGRGFPVPVFAAQAVFRAVMTALAEPGTVQTIDSGGAQCDGLSSAMTAIALTLADFETPVWLDMALNHDAAAHLRFRTGAPLTSDATGAVFAVVTRPRMMPPLSAFAQGTLDYPCTSTTVLIDVESIDTTRGWTLTGPGIEHQRRLAISSLPATFTEQIITNRAAFPCGVDLIFCAGTRIVALPRSTRVVHTGEAR